MTQLTYMSYTTYIPGERDFHWYPDKHPEKMKTRIAIIAVIFALLFSGCGKDSYITETERPTVSVEFGDGVEITTPTTSVVRLFSDFTPGTYQGRPAILLRNLIGADLVEYPDLYGYRLIGTDGFYANMPGKDYGDNTWAQLSRGYLDLVNIQVQFETETDPNLRKGHNVKWLILVELLRSIDIHWADKRKLAPVSALTVAPLPEGYQSAGADAIVLTSFVAATIPADVDPAEYQYRVQSRSGATLPRLLTWEEMATAYYLPESEQVVMAESLGDGWSIDLPKKISLEGGAR
jgi:hypothetical protein